ncbi:hypothetical protein CSB09_03845, partial [Candidatus Gracilibacteria bacterium]
MTGVGQGRKRSPRCARDDGKRNLKSKKENTEENLYIVGFGGNTAKRFFSFGEKIQGKKSMSDDESQFYYDERKASVGASLFLPRI